jgi:hypothetical protein
MASTCTNFTMMQVVLHQFPGAQVEYKFKCRTPGVQLASHALTLSCPANWLLFPPPLAKRWPM